MELVVNLISRSSHTAALRATPLNHKAVDHPVKNETIIKSRFHELDKISRRNGRFVLEEFETKVTFGRNEMDVPIGHNLTILPAFHPEKLSVPRQSLRLQSSRAWRITPDTQELSNASLSLHPLLFPAPAPPTLAYGSTVGAWWDAATTG
jgi:hypothetical protein